MDYNDNDYQNQHFHLGGEDNNNFLRPFSLPKIDLDDHLQVHLRFDSLDEPEDILGIRVQEGNNWIHDYHSGSCGIEFSSGPAESCTISKQNIWSEATSTESVEMLLKSVGEDDMLKNKAATDSASDEVLNNTNNDTSSALQSEDACLVDVIKAELPPLHNYSSPGINRDSSLPSSHVKTGHQSLGDGKVECKNPKDRDKCSTNEGSEKVLEGESSNFSPYIHGESHGEVTEVCSLGNPYLDISVSDHRDRSVKGKVPLMTQLSDFDNQVTIPVMEKVASLIHSSQRSSGDIKVSIEELQSESSELLAPEIQEHQLPHSGKCNNHCHPEGNMLGDSSFPSEFPSTSVVRTDSSNLITVHKESLHSREADELLEVIVDELKFSNERRDVLASQIEQQQLLLTNNEIGMHHTEVHPIADSCTGIKDHLRTKELPSHLTSTCDETILCNQADGLLEVIVDRVKLLSKNNDLEKIECDSVQECKESSPVTFSRKEVEPLAGVCSDEKSSESSQNIVGGDTQVSLPTIIGKDDPGNCEGRSEEKQYFSDSAVEVPSETYEAEGMQTTVTEGYAEHESHNLMLNTENKNDDRSSETVVNDSGIKVEGNVKSSYPSNDAGNMLVTPCNADLMEPYHSCSADGNAVPSGNPHEDSTRQCVVPVDDPDYNGSVIINKKFTELVPQVCDDSSASVLDKLTSETNPDIAAENLSSLEIPSLFAESKDVEQSSDGTHVSVSERKESTVSCFPSSDLICKDQNDAELSRGFKEPCIYNHEMLDSFQAAPSDDGHSLKETLISESISFVKSSDNPPVAAAKSKTDETVDYSEVCMRELCTSAMPSESAVIEPNPCYHNGDPSAIVSFNRDSHDETEMQDVIKGLSDPSSSLLSNFHTTNTENILGQEESTHENFKESCATLEERRSPLPDSQLQKFVPESSTTTGVDKCDSGLSVRVTFQENEITVDNAVNEVQIHDTIAKSTGKGKGRSASGASGAKRKSVKEPQSSRKAARKSKNNTVSSSLEDIQPQSPLEGRNVKPSGSIVQPSNLPDLNSAASGTSLFSQPFTDAQQVQLRAQILVYGYLIQGISPEEACMVSAFGDDGERITWEGVWHVFSEKYRNQKSPMFRTPSRPVIKPLDPVATYSPLPNRANTPACQTGNKSSVPFSSTISLQSPIWSVVTHDFQNSTITRGSVADPSRILSPLHAYHSPQVRQYAVNAHSWPGQSPASVSLVPSNLGMNTQISALRSGEGLQLPHTKELSSHHNPSAQLVSSGTLSSLPGTFTVSSSTVMQTDTISPLPNKEISCEPKSRKKKKSVGLEASKQTFIACQTSSEPVSASGQSKPLGYPISTSISNKASTASLVSSVYPILSPTHFQVVGTSHADRVILSEETCTKIEQARQQAEDAAASASAAVRHSESIWNQLVLQKNSGLVSEIEQKLASAAVAAAAASVAKAAAAAAKVAANAALQAKFISDEALASNKAVKASSGAESSSGNVICSSDSIHNDIVSSSSSIISAAREGARRRVEAASAAAKRAEILDAIVKAAELASVAVSQAGAVVAMGDPLPFNLNEMLDAGPENYWKGHQSKRDILVKANIYSGAHITKDNTDCQETFVAHPSLFPLNREETSHFGKDENAQLPNDHVRQPVESCTATAHRDNSDDRVADDAYNHSIKEGSIVEISSDENDQGSIWHSAHVLNIKDEQAHVCYNTLVADEGSGKLKAWVPLKESGDRPPRIRVAHPLTTVENEGNRKRRREVVAAHTWNVGDRVDAWIQDGWSEGIITEKCNGDETKLTVCFSAGGGSSIVRSWDLRPSLVWKEGAWIEWPREGNAQHDTPKEKRQKLNGSRDKYPSETEGLGTSLLLKNSVSDDHPQLLLSAKEQIFSIGKSSEKGKQTAMQKQGSGVVFGGSRPGKKRKFMDVSNHCVVDNREKVKERSSSIKFAKSLIPQSSHGWKMTPKVDQKLKQPTALKGRTTKTAKPQIPHSRKAVGGDGSSTSKLVTVGDGGSMHEPFSSEFSAASHVDEKLEQNIHLEVSLSNAVQASDVPVSARLHHIPEVSFGNRSSSRGDVEHTRKGKLSAREKALGSDDKGSDIVYYSSKTLGASEPRRSNRRIQPTSRLLEGLQSSLMISKIPSAPLDKGAKTTPRGALATRGRTLHTRG